MVLLLIENDCCIRTRILSQITFIAVREQSLYWDSNSVMDHFHCGWRMIAVSGLMPLSLPKMVLLQIENVIAVLGLKF
jgi:hypothetical protein